jgi:nucleotide-binding universal stress UspA family protein
MPGAAQHGVVVGVDGSPESRDALRWATAEAIMRDLPLRLVYVVGPRVTAWSSLTEAINPIGQRLASTEMVLERAVKTVTVAAGRSRSPCLHTEVRRGEIVCELLRASTESLMTVIGGCGRGLFVRAVLGPVSRGLLSRAEAPVAIVHSSEHSPPPSHFPVLLGLDDSCASEGAAALAFDEAARRKVDLVVLHAWTDTVATTVFGIDMERFEREGHGVLAERLAPWQPKYPEVNVRHRLVVDQPARRLVDLSRESQIVVVGSRGRGGFAGLLLGSVSSEVARSADAPTIVVRTLCAPTDFMR